jgi:SpoVK/Ycf46/Vps4 family AAA+-type ATPase
MENLYATLVSNNIIQPVPPNTMGDFIGGFNYLGATLEKAGILPDASLAQVRQMVTEYGILPMASRALHERVPHAKTMLLFGTPSCGKTLLSYALANAIGANFFNISPRNTDAKYPGKSVSMLTHMVFKVAKTMAPSVVYIDEVEKVFCTDKKKMKEYGGVIHEPFTRIKKELLKEVKALSPGDRVLVIGNSQCPQLCQKKDEKALMEFFQKHVYLPLPDYASMRLLWPGLVTRHQGSLDVDFDLSTLAQLSEGYSAGTINLVCRTLLSERRVAKLERKPLAVREILMALAKFPPVSKEQDQELRDWQNRLPHRKVEGEGGKEKKAKKGGKKKK